MSRFSDDYDEDFPNQFALYQANTDRALEGRRGQAFLREMEEALVALPFKRLISGRICEGGEVCAMGAFALKRKRDAGEDIKAALEWLEGEDPGDGMADDTAAFCSRHFGVMERLAIQMAYVNDEHGSHQQTPGERYEMVLKWVRGKIKEIPNAAV